MNDKASRAACDTCGARIDGPAIKAGGVDPTGSVYLHRMPIDCIAALRAKIETQANDLAKLRGFAGEIEAIWLNDHCTTGRIAAALMIHDLIDATGNSTPLLTGEGE